MITVTEAEKLLRQHVVDLGVERVSLAEAEGRVLREEVAAERDYPPFNRVAMDGIAIDRDTWQKGRRRFAVQGVQQAGEPALRLDDPAGCIEIMTGAALPEGCNAVVRYEDVEFQNGTAAVADDIDVPAWQNVHRRGVDRAGGEPILQAGTRLRPHHIAALASVGRAQVEVSLLPSVTVLSTGDELVGVDEPVEPHQIRQSNGHAIRAGLVQRGLSEVRVVHAEDRKPALREHTGKALGESDVLILSGGVSAGRYDLVPEVLDELGVEEVFHKIRQKPGKPMWFGISQEKKLVFGLPGNPVSALVCCYRYVLPFVDRMMGLECEARLSAFITELPRRKKGRTHFVPVALEGEKARPVPTNGSGDFLSVLASDGFVEISLEVEDPGFVPFFPWSGVG